MQRRAFPRLMLAWLIASAGPARAVYASEPMVVEMTLDGKRAKVITVRQGARVRLLLRTTTVTDLHLHGYDLTAHAGPHEPALFEFEARHAGRFSIGTHGGKDLLGRREAVLAYVEVRPE